MEYGIIMRSKLSSFLLIMTILLAASCISGKKEADQTPQAVPQPKVEDKPAETVQVQPPEEQPVVMPPEEAAPLPVQAPEPAAVTFDPREVSREQFDSTKEEVQHFIEELNRIIADGNYNAWKAALSKEYFDEISSPENLQEISELPAMTTRKIVLKTAEDYFRHVVVPSRANSRVDDIEFIGRERVKAFTINTTRSGEEQRLRLYDLEKIGNTWKIIN